MTRDERIKIILFSKKVTRAGTMRRNASIGAARRGATSGILRSGVLRAVKKRSWRRRDDGESADRTRISQVPYDEQPSGSAAAAQECARSTRHARSPECSDSRTCRDHVNVTHNGRARMRGTRHRAGRFAAARSNRAFKRVSNVV